MVVKISPQDKKTKTLRTHTSPLKMASADNSEHFTTISSMNWKQLMEKIDIIGQQTGEISELKKTVAELKKKMCCPLMRNINIWK